MKKIPLSSAASVKFLDGGFMEITVSPGVGPGLVELPARETEILRNALNKRHEEMVALAKATGLRPRASETQRPEILVGPEVELEAVLGRRPPGSDL